MDLGIFQETKLTDGIYTRWLAGYIVVTTDAPSRHGSGVAIFHRPASHFAVEAVQQFRTNVIGLQLATGGVAMVHRGMLPLSQRHLNDRECC